MSLLGFKLLPVKFNASSKSSQILYIKEHIVREKNASKPADKTLFVLNVPPYCNKFSLARLFNKCGKVKKVFIHDKPTGEEGQSDDQMFSLHKHPTGYRVAYVVFKEQEGLQNAMKLDDNLPYTMSTKKHPIEVGIKKWCSEYNNRLTTESDLQASVDSFMETFDKQEYQRQKVEKLKSYETDDGWKTVTRFSTKKGIPRMENFSESLLEGEEKKKEKKQLLNFYTFQIKESKMKHIAEVRERLERDQMKVELMKNSRKFKPY